MATVTASLERSLQNCSLNQSSTTRSRRGSGGVGGGGGIGRSSSSDSSDIINHHHQQYDDDYHQHHQQQQRPHNNNREGVAHSNASSSDDNNSTFVELNSHVSLPYHWEQCLDLKTGELYYLNWSTGMKAKEDPRTTAAGYNGDYYSEEEEDEEEDEDESSPYDSEGSSTESSSCSSTRESFRLVKTGRHQLQQQGEEEEIRQDSVLVVAGCKSCLMYYMVAKHEDQCPKCSGQLLHFAANNNSSP